MSKTLMDWGYIVAIIFFMVACAVWCLMIVGAWVASIEAPGVLRPIALRIEYARPILKAMVREVVALIIAVAFVITGIVYSSSSSAKLSSSITTHLCQVRGDSTPGPIIMALKTFSDLPSEFDNTLKAYNLFLQDPHNTELDLVEALLPGKKSVYDYRLLGLIYGIIATHKTSRSMNYRITYFRKSLESFKTAIELAGQVLPGNPTVEAAVDFRAALQSNLATTYVGLAWMMGEGAAERDTLLTDARDIFEDLITKFGKRPADFNNLVMVLAMRGEWEKIIPVLDEASQERRLSIGDKEFLKHQIKKLKDQAKEIRDMSPGFYNTLRQLENEQQKSWETIVEESFSGGEK